MKKDRTQPKVSRGFTVSGLTELLPLMEECLAAGQSVKFSPRGVSMLPMIVQGRDSVTLSSPPDRLKKFDIPLYRRKDGSFVLHRVIRVADTYTCMGDNQFKAEKGIAQDQIIGVVTAFTRKGRTYAVSHGGYRFYCVLWHISRPLRRVWRALRGRAARLKRKISSRWRRNHGT